MRAEKAGSDGLPRASRQVEFPEPPILVDPTTGRLLVDSVAGGSSTSADTVTVPTVLLKTVAASGTPERFTATDTYFKWGIIQGDKDYVATPNDDTVFFGDASHQSQPIITGGAFMLPPISGKKYNLKDILLRVLTNGNGGVITYWN